MSYTVSSLGKVWDINCGSIEVKVNKDGYSDTINVADYIEIDTEDARDLINVLREAISFVENGE